MAIVISSSSSSFWTIVVFLGLAFSHQGSLSVSATTATATPTTPATSSGGSSIGHNHDLHIASIRKVKDDLVEISWTVNSTTTSPTTINTTTTNTTTPNNNNTTTNNTITTNNTNINNTNNNNPPGSSSPFSNFIVSYEILKQIKTKPTTSSSSSASTSTSITDEGLEFRSGYISPDIRSISIHFPYSDHLRICIQGEKGHDANSTEKTCSDWSNPKNKHGDGDDDDDEKEGTDVKKLIAGISAGCVFLIPCIVVLLVIMRKDKQMKLSSIYEELGGEHLNPSLDLKDEEKALKNADGNEEERRRRMEEDAARVKGGGVGGGEEELRSLSVSNLKGVSGPTIVIHSGDDDTDSDNDVLYSERL